MLNYWYRLQLHKFNIFYFHMCCIRFFIHHWYNFLIFCLVFLFIREIDLKFFSLVITSWVSDVKMMFFILQNELKSVSLFLFSKEVHLRLMLLLQMPCEKDWLWQLGSHFWAFLLGFDLLILVVLVVLWCFQTDVLYLLSSTYFCSW